MEVKFISIGELKELSERKEKILLVDVRSREEYRSGHFKNAVNIPESMFEIMEEGDNTVVCRLRRYDYAGYKIILYCERGNSSMLCAKRLLMKNIVSYSLSGGISGKNIDVVNNLEYYDKRNNVDVFEWR